MSERAPPRLAAGVADSATRSCETRMRLLGFARSLGKGCVLNNTGENESDLLCAEKVSQVMRRT